MTSTRSVSWLLSVAFVAARSALALAPPPAPAPPIGRDVSECVNDVNDVSSDVCVVNSGQTGVDRIIFDRAMRRHPTTTAGGASIVTAPLSVVAVEATGVSPGGAVDLLVLNASGLWLTPNDAAPVSGLNVSDVADVVGPPIPIAGNSTLVVPAFALLPSGSTIPTNARVDMFAGWFTFSNDLTLSVTVATSTSFIVNAINLATWLVTRPWTSPAGIGTSTLRDVEMTSLDDIGFNDFLVLTNSSIYLFSGWDASVTQTAIAAFTSDAELITTRDIAGSTTPEVFVVERFVEAAEENVAHAFTVEAGEPLHATRARAAV